MKHETLMLSSEEGETLLPLAPAPLTTDQHTVLRRRKPRLFTLAAAMVTLAGFLAMAYFDPPYAGDTGDIGRAFYFSPEGDDSRDGNSPGTAWRTLTRAESVTFRPGDKLLLQGGARFEDGLSFESDEAGDASKPVIVDSYGAGRAIIKTIGSGVSVHSTAGIEINNLVIVGEGSGGTSYSDKNGINIYNDLPDGRKLEHVAIFNVDVSGFKSGIAIGGQGTAGFRDLRVTDSAVHGNKEFGLFSYGSPFNAQAPSYAHESILVSGVEAYGNPGDPDNHVRNTGSGIVLGSVRGATIERSSAHDNGIQCAAEDGPGGIWTYDSTNVTIQHNVSYHNRTGGPSDGDGFDLDQNVSASVLQYNFSYENDGAGYLLYSGLDNGAHTGNTVRFNISYNDTRKVEWYGGISLTRWVHNVDVYHNTVFTEANGSVHSPALRLWGSLSDIRIRNNIFMAGETALVDMYPASTEAQILLQGNDYFSFAGPWTVRWGSVTYSTLNSWRSASGQKRLGHEDTELSIDPGFVMDRSGPAVFMPQEDSPVVGKALDIRGLFGIDEGARDYFGRPIRRPPTIGAAGPEGNR